MKNKIVTLDYLTKLLIRLKKAKKKIVLCHGVFDLLHIGHIKHFEQAKMFGDVLIVTITPDKYINKGPNRPFFNSSLRSEALASLKSVDYVAVNLWPDAVKTIKLLKPHFYCKGYDYKKHMSDLTKKISEEQESIKSVKGKIIYTSSKIYSSSNLINEYFENFNNDQRKFLRNIKTKHNFTKIEELIANLKKLKVLLIGETIIDQYVFCDALGKSGKEPILAMREIKKEQYFGGVIAIAKHISTYCKSITILTVLGEKSEYLDYIKNNLPNNVFFKFIKKVDNSTIVKKRYIENINKYKLFGIYKINDDPLNLTNQNQLIKLLKIHMPKNDLIITSDYGHGFIVDKTASQICKSKLFKSLNAQINAANIGYHTLNKYKNLDLLIINETELRHELRDKNTELKILMKKLSIQINTKILVVTCGASGAFLLEKKSNLFFHCPAFANKVIDKVGSGDAMLSILSIMIKSKIDFDLALFLSSIAAADSVANMGNIFFFVKDLMLKKVYHMLR